VIRYGLIADEVEEVASQYVDEIAGEINGEEVTDIKSTSLTAMIPMMMKAIQELSTKVTALEA
jgi:membrane protease subunit (stomatin/prohibitin family)